MRIILAAVVLTAAGCAAPSPYIAGVASEGNLALGRPYTLEPQPDYPAPSAGSVKALHDGVLGKCGSTRVPGLTWCLPAGKSVRIVVDLGEPRPIEEVIVHTSGHQLKPPAKIRSR